MVLQEFENLSTLKNHFSGNQILNIIKDKKIFVYNV